jgi:hypothetical protein
VTHAIDQVRGWLQVVDDDRLAMLDTLRLSRDMVSSVRGVVIAGRDRVGKAMEIRGPSSRLQTRCSSTSICNGRHLSLAPSFRKETTRWGLMGSQSEPSPAFRSVDAATNDRL